MVLGAFTSSRGFACDGDTWYIHAPFDLKRKLGGSQMDMTEVAIHARKMFDLTGPKAIAIAASKARESEAEGDVARAETWRRVRDCLMERAGPRAT
jgi:hypothetical protein